MKIKIGIERDMVYEIVEGLSLTMATHQHLNYNDLWASKGDGRKLDIYYRQAITDYEQQFQRDIVETTGMFDVMAVPEDYAVTFDLSDRWDVKLTGLLRNKTHEYMVSSVLAQWLADFGLENAKPDYGADALVKLAEIQETISYRNVDDETGARRRDNVYLGDDGCDCGCDIRTAGRRHQDNIKIKRHRQADVDWGKVRGLRTHIKHHRHEIYDDEIISEGLTEL